MTRLSKMEQDRLRITNEYNIFCNYRDEFAKCALIGILGSPLSEGEILTKDINVTEIAYWAYDIAEAMILERSKRIDAGDPYAEVK